MDGPNSTTTVSALAIGDRATGPLEMSEPTYRELATNFTLWCKFILLESRFPSASLTRLYRREARYPSGMLRPRDPCILPTAALSRRHTPHVSGNCLFWPDYVSIC
jgi:hypothetical protein